MTLWVAAGVVNEAAAHSSFSSSNFATISTNITNLCTANGRPAPATTPVTGCADCHTGYPTPLTAKGSAYKGYFEGTQNATTLSTLLNTFCPAPANVVPTLTVPANPTVTAGSAVNFTVSGTGPEAGQTVTFSATGVPSGATFNSSTGAFAWPSAVAGTYNVAFTATDNGSPPLSSAPKTVTITVNPPANVAPTLTVPANPAVTAGSAVNFSVSGTGPEAGQTVTFSATGVPSGATFNSSTGAFAWPSAVAGTYNVAFTATDNGTPPLSSAPKTVTVTVNAAPTNSSPGLTLTPSGDQTVTEGQTVSITAAATDPENDPVTITATPLPTGATFNGSAFVWTTGAGDGGAAGMPYSVTFTATDQPSNGASPKSISQSVTITVMPPAVSNHAPVLETIPSPQNATIGQALKFSVFATDQDDDTLTLSAANLPVGATFTPQGLVNGKWTGEFAWTPVAGQTNATITFKVTDDYTNPAQDMQDVVVQVNPAANDSSITALEIGQAVWTAGKLVVSGSVKTRTRRIPSGLYVRLFNDVTGAELGQAPVGRRGFWTFRGSEVACKVRAELEGKIATRTVSRAPERVCSGDTGGDDD